MQRTMRTILDLERPTNADRVWLDPPSPHTLIQRIAVGDSAALDALYALYSRQLLSYLIGQLTDRQLAEEVLQDVMLAVWKSAARFQGNSSVLTWLLAIARHHAINARGRRKLPLSTLYDSAVGHDPELSRSLEQDADRAQIQTALSHLSAEQRETLELIFYHELSGAEAANVLGVAPGTIKSRLSRALITLRRVLRKEDLSHE